MKRVLKFYLPILIIAIFAIAGVIVGSYFDKQIATQAMHRNNPFGIIFTAIGQIPTMSLGIFGSAVLVFIECKTKLGKFFARLIGIGSVIVMSFFLFISAKDYAEFDVMLAHETLYKILIGILILFIVVFILFLAKKLCKILDRKKFLTIAIIIVSIVISYAAATEIVKVLASRPRPTVVLSAQEEFVNWYNWNPFYCFKADDCKSFVSGHTANSACLITLLPLLITITKLRDKKISYVLAFVIGLFYTFVVAFSRMIAGEHFLSDLMWGVLISLIFQSLCLGIVPLFLKKFGPKE